MPVLVWQRGLFQTPWTIVVGDECLHHLIPSTTHGSYRPTTRSDAVLTYAQAANSQGIQTLLEAEKEAAKIVQQARACELGSL